MFVYMYKSRCRPEDVPELGITKSRLNQRLELVSTASVGESHNIAHLFDQSPSDVMGHKHKLGPSHSLQGQYFLEQLDCLASEALPRERNGCLINEGVAIKKRSSVLKFKTLSISPA